MPVPVGAPGYNKVQDTAPPGEGVVFIFIMLIIATLLEPQPKVNCCGLIRLNVGNEEAVTVACFVIVQPFRLLISKYV